MKAVCCSDKCERQMHCANHAINNEGTNICENFDSYATETMTENGCDIKYWCGELGEYKMYEPVVVKRCGWIPCREALPECNLIRDVFNRPQCYMSDSVLVTVKSDECDGVHYFVSTDYMSGKTKEDTHWMMSCGYSGSAVYNQEIIAWMYKPEPYKILNRGKHIC